MCWRESAAEVLRVGGFGKYERVAAEEARCPARENNPQSAPVASEPPVHDVRDKNNPTIRVHNFLYFYLHNLFWSAPRVWVQGQVDLVRLVYAAGGGGPEKRGERGGEAKIPRHVDQGPNQRPRRRVSETHKERERERCRGIDSSQLRFLSGAPWPLAFLRDRSR